jgi:hypothetical protein
MAIKYFMAVTILLDRGRASPGQGDPGLRKTRLTLYYLLVPLVPLAGPEGVLRFGSAG